MDKKYICPVIISFIIIFSFSLAKVKAQVNPEEIIAKSVEAQGGRDALEKVKDQVVIATIKAFTPQGTLIGEQKVYSKTEPIKVRVEQTLLGMTIIIGFDGETIWLEQMGNVMTAPPAIANPLKASIARENLLLKYKERECKVQYLGESEVDKQSCHQIKFTDKEGNETILYFDVKTFFPIKSEYSATGQEGAIVKNELIFSDFKPVENLMFPFKTISYSNGNKTAETVITEIKINQDLEDSLFLMPEKK